MLLLSFPIVTVLGKSRPKRVGDLVTGGLCQHTAHALPPLSIEISGYSFTVTRRNHALHSTAARLSDANASLMKFYYP